MSTHRRPFATIARPSHMGPPANLVSRSSSASPSEVEASGKSAANHEKGWPEGMGSPPSADPEIRERAYHLVRLLARTLEHARADGVTEMSFIDFMGRAAKEDLLVEPRFRRDAPDQVNGVVFRTAEIIASGSDLGQVQHDGRTVGFKYRDLARLGISPLLPEEVEAACQMIEGFKDACVMRLVRDDSLSFSDAMGEYDWTPRYGRQGKATELDQARLDAAWREERHPLRFTVLRRHYDYPAGVAIGTYGRQPYIPRAAGKLQEPNANVAEHPEATIQRSEDSPRWGRFDARAVAIRNDVDSLADYLVNRTRRDELVVTGALIDPTSTVGIRRISSNLIQGEQPTLREQTSTFFFADVDGWAAPDGLDVIADRARLARLYTDTVLHRAFHGADCFVQLSASAGLKAVGEKTVPAPTRDKPDRTVNIKYYRLLTSDERRGGPMKAHIGYCLSRPLDDAKRKLLMEWVQAVRGLSIREGAPDPALAQCAQQHYIHVDWRGMPDPFAAERNGIVCGARRTVDVEAIDWEEIRRIVGRWEAGRKRAETGNTDGQAAVPSTGEMAGARGAVRKHLLLVGDGRAPNGVTLQGFRKPMIAAIAAGVRVELPRDEVRAIVEKAFKEAPGANARTLDIATYLSKFDAEWDDAFRKFGQGGNHRESYARANGMLDDDGQQETIEAATSPFGQSSVETPPQPKPIIRRPLGAVSARRPPPRGSDV